MARQVPMLPSVLEFWFCVDNLGTIDTVVRNLSPNMVRPNTSTGPNISLVVWRNTLAVLSVFFLFSPKGTVECTVPRGAVKS